MKNTLKMAIDQDDAFRRQLSLEDQTHLADFEALLNILRDRVRAAALKYQMGAYIVGRPGTGKTWAVVDALRQLEQEKEHQVSYTLKNAKMTAPGLWRLLNDYRESTVVLDDIPSATAERPAQMIIMAALSGEAGKARKVTMSTGEADGRKDFDFNGSIIAISNVSLRRNPLADAIASRIPLLEFEPSDEQIAALMRLLALKNPGVLKPQEALDVIEFVISESRAGEYRLDLRTMNKALGDYQCWLHRQAKTDWKDLVRSFLKKLATIGHSTPVSRLQKREALLTIAATISAKFSSRKQRSERETEWTAKTGLSADQLYRYMRMHENEAA